MYKSVRKCVEKPKKTWCFSTRHAKPLENVVFQEKLHKICCFSFFFGSAEIVAGKACVIVCVIGVFQGYRGVEEVCFEQACLCDSLCDTPFSEIVASEAPERFPGTITQILVHSA